MSRRARTGTGKPGWRSGLIVLLAVMSALSLTAASAMADIGDGSTLDPVSIEASNTPSSATESGATIVSDKADYSPGETVVLTGEGWQPGEAVQIVVKDDGLQTEAWQHDATVTADEHGTISDQFEPAHLGRRDVHGDGHGGGLRHRLHDLHRRLCQPRLRRRAVEPHRGHPPHR